ncbi:MAG: hypothetical protein PHO91_03805 [Patescibacteria group bacterium]|nr:hypothetical protein [Patescibacteria group bacterium]
MSINALRVRLIALLEKVGYPTSGAEFICNRLTTIARLYDNAQGAMEIIVQNMEDKITGPFSSQQFSTFAKEISPSYTPWYLYEEKLGVRPDEVDCLPARDQEDYWREKRQLDHKLSALRRANLSYLRDSTAWDILTKHNWREIQPSLGLYRQIKGSRPISTPLGGQPGYKRRTRRS